MVVVSLNLLDPVLDAMEEPQAQPMIAGSGGKGWSFLIRIPTRWPRLRDRISGLQWRYENFRQR